MKSIVLNRKKNGLLYLLIAATISILLASCKQENQPKAKEKNHREEIRKILDSADFFFDNSKLDSAYFYFNKANSLCDPERNTNYYVYSLSCMAEIIQLEGDYITSENILAKTLPYLKRTTRPRYPWFTYTIMAQNYHSTFDYNNAIKYHIQALHYTFSSGKKASTLNKICSVYIDQKKYKEAISLLVFLCETEDVFKKDRPIDQIEYARTLDNLGYCYAILKNPKALECYKKSLKIKTELKDEEKIMYSHQNLAMYYQKTNPELAKKYAKLAYNTSLKLKAVLLRERVLIVLQDCTEGTESKDYALKYLKLNDSIVKSRQNKKNQFVLIKYNSQKDKDENLLLKARKIENELQLERQKNRSNIAYVILSFSTFLALFLFYYLKSKGKKEKSQAIYKSESRISKKLHDELANDVYQTLAFAEIHELDQKENKEKLLRSLDDIYSKTRNISKENSLIKVDHDYPKVLKEMISGFKTSNLNILLNGFDAILWSEVGKNERIILYRVLQELLVNMKKNSNATLVGINFKRTDKNIEINYTDNGQRTGINKIDLQNDFQNIKLRLLDIKGTIKIDDTSIIGFKAFIKFPA
ncbi:tetratricopeptide repeat-containing sensor histidine kinase [Flavobacterium branchiicola]|uniref:ATP-binding protein n=1 Tax=Flavobacterium branchiicola TaxID=1114875 RepID=A0ABV9PKW2_9FLAO|nr:tetratricopeptide repeat-containing sensor histidine kinase [Flavobacterium branchiicola]MBS7255745.1 ATP-binding protein [Flavobacterium branchiicola]